MEQWPMGELTRKVGDTRKLLVHPKKIIKREDIDVKALSHPDEEIIPLNAIPSSVQTDVSYVVEKKLQGHRYFYSRDIEGEYHLWSRRLNVSGQFTNGLTKIGLDWAEFPAFKPLPRGTCLDGELIWPSHPDSAVPTCMKNHPEKLRYVPFGLPFFRKQDFRSEGLRTVRDIIEEELGYESVEIHETIAHLRTREHLRRTLEKLYRQARKEGIEGYVLKRVKPHYGIWYKMKTIMDSDVFVIGSNISSSETKYGEVTSVNIGVFNDRKEIVDMGSVSGFDLTETHALTRAFRKYGDSKANPYYRRTLRVLYQERAAKGKLKHAFFDCWRPDKNFRDCTLEQFA